MGAEPVIDIEGLVYVDTSEDDSSKADPIALDDLVAGAVSPDMLEDEPKAAELLLRFRQRLLSSLDHVNTALKSLSKP
jgi:hypothetical protein